MRIITPAALRDACDMVNHLYLDDTFYPKPSGVVLCYSKLETYVKDTAQALSSGPYIFVLNGSDDSFTYEIIDRYPKVVYWFVTNCEVVHPRVEAIPAGIYANTEERTRRHVEWLDELRQTPRKIQNVVFGCHTLKGKSRELARESIEGKPFARWEKKLGLDEFLMACQTHTFTISPKGDGCDCQRTWEILYMGGWPIVQRCIPYEHFTDLPIALVDSWEDTRGVHWYWEQAHKMVSKSTKRLDANYWIRRIRTKAEELLGVRCSGQLAR